ncbi:flagellar hook-basal body complex protein FliE [Bacillus sp. RG28]|uniref:Flagellar hook-basal body complex protein FliE n=1 Tax=Gottfriedia endophytica TaxID=2820819 RepID=A0A940SLF1_9BACI|nr:flagellar hook-basal body complex protein FliE [Gottfriedia endophytica]MBP0726243.1 flagellar hook-basal body complex protein FliE [Gottfriedia endophytica]
MNPISQVNLQNLQPINMNSLQNNSGGTQTKFANFLKDSINELNDSQVKSIDSTTKLVKGDNIDLHNVMIDAEKANITLQTAIEIRNKVIDAYQEIMRMQM